jgi:hypothetical protein
MPVEPGAGFAAVLLHDALEGAADEFLADGGSDAAGIFNARVCKETM